MPRAADLTEPVHVVAGVLTDPRGRVLLARRSAGRDLAGDWEFPGGKLEAGETPFQALDRELHEELGVRIHAMQPLIRVAQAYPNKRIVLDIYSVSRFSGKPHGRENQALVWSPPAKLVSYKMPPADRPVVAALTQPSQYLITPDVGADPDAFLGSLDRAIKAGARRLQLRVGQDGNVAELASRAKLRCDKAGVQLLLNEDIEMARKLGCGVHLRSSQLDGLRVRPLPKEAAVAASCHDRSDLVRAERLGVDFVVLGPVAKTPSHPERPALGWKRFVELREHTSLPIYALGGMKPGDHEAARRHGAQGIAAIRGLWPD